MKRTLYALLSVFMVASFGLAACGTPAPAVPATAAPASVVTEAPSTAPSATSQSSNPLTATSATVVGTTRDNPIPVGSPVDIGGGVILSVVKAVRPADTIVMSGNQSNAAPAAGQEYVEVDLKVDCKKSASEKCSFLDLTLQAVGSDGKVIDPEVMLAGNMGMMGNSTDISGRASVQGKMFYIVRTGDKAVVLVYPALSGNPVYFGFQQ